MGDIVAVKVYGEPTLSGTFQVYPDCQIELPLIHQIQVCKKTPAQIQVDIADRLYKDFFRIRPTVVVSVQAFNSKQIYVFGEVSKPGRYTYLPSMTLIQLIAITGGFTKSAARNDTRVIRKSDGKKKIYRIPLGALGKKGITDFSLMPGDIVFVPESWI